VWKNITTKVDRRRALVWGMALLLAVLVLVIAGLLYERHQLLREGAQSEESPQSPEGVSEEYSESVALYGEALEAVGEDYVDQEEIDLKEQTYDAIKGMLDSLGDERHTRFLTPEEMDRDKKVIYREISTGVRLEDGSGEVVVLGLVGGSPAEKAGVEPGDVLLAVDGESVQGRNIIEATDKLKGPEKSTVNLTLLRDGQVREFSMRRTELEVPAASWYLIPETDVAYLRLALFSENSAKEFEDIIAEAQEGGAQRFVLDLRDNRGGRVRQAEKIAARFLPARSVIYSERDGHGEEREVTVPKDNEPLSAPLVVMVNEESKSAAEIVAGALRDNERAEVIGETTNGAGTVLDEYPLSDGSGLLLAVAEWLTPKGDSIRGSGIEPDVEEGLEEGQIPRTPDEIRGLSREEVFAEDAQLERAFEVLQRG